MKNKNTVLLIIFLLLASVLAFTKVFRTPAKEGNLNTETFQLDTGRISEFAFRKTDVVDEIRLKRNESAWIVQQGSRTAMVRSFDRKQFMRTVSNLRPDRVVTRNKEKWPQYQVDDTTAIRVTAYSSEQPVAEWLIGKESQGSTYLRKAQAPEVYAIDGNLRGTFDKTFNEWRDKTFMKMETSDLTRVTFQYPADSGFSLTKQAGEWRLEGQKADSLKVEQFVTSLRMKELSQIEEGFDAKPTEAPFTVIISRSGEADIVIKGWKQNDTRWVLNSSQLEDLYFRDTFFARDLFRGSGWFMNR